MRITLTGLAERLARAQAAHPWKFLGVALAVTLVAAVGAAQLTFDSSYQALLPPDSDEVRNLTDIQERTGGTRQLVVAIGGAEPEQRLDFGRRLAARLRELQGIRRVDSSLPLDLIRERGIWLLETETLEELVHAGELAVENYSREGDINVLGLLLDRVASTLEERRGDLPYDGVMTSNDGRYTFILVIPSVSLSDLPALRDLYERIQATTASLDPGAEGLVVDYAGTLRLYHEGHQKIGSDLKAASIVAFLLGVLVVAGFTRRPLAPLSAGIALLPGILWTYALTWLFKDSVNMVTGFLGAVLVGLGIDFSVHIFVRYQQEFERSRCDALKAITRCVVGTLPPALTAATTTAGTFYAFAAARFPGFYEFGLVAGTGVLMTLISTFTILPTLLYVSSHRWKVSGAFAASERGSRCGPPRQAIPLWAAASVVAAFALVAVYGGLHITDVPFRNNFRELRGTSAATEFTDYVNESLGAGFNPAVFVTPTLDGAGRIAGLARQAAANNAAEAAAEQPRIGRVLSVHDLLPHDLEARRALIGRLRTLLDDPTLVRAEREAIEGSEHIAAARRLVSTEPWGVEELPEAFRQRLLTLDQRAYIIFVWPTVAVDADYQAMDWDRELSALSAAVDAEGIGHSMVDESLMTGWISRLVLEDAPLVLPIAVAVVFLFLLLDFRSVRQALLAAFPLLVGMLCFMAVVHLLGRGLNMFNMIVIPSVVGIGIDAVVHLQHRYKQEGRGSVIVVLRSTGVAVFLASLTTAIGFGSSLVCSHVGLQSLGLLAVIGIASTFLAALVFFPSMLTIIEWVGSRSDSNK